MGSVRAWNAAIDLRLAVRASRIGRLWTGSHRGIYCLPGALAPYGISAVVVNAGIGDAQDVRDVARSDSVALVDVFDAFEHYAKIPGQSIEDLLLAGDGIHPNQAGQNLVCRMLTARIAEMLAPRSAEQSHP